MPFRLLIAILRFQARLLSWMMTALIDVIRSVLGLFSGPTPKNTNRSAPLVPSSVPEKVLDRSFTNDAGTRSYKLFIPHTSPTGAPRALIVMLHGCKQNPDDFAAGTCMNRLGERHGYLVAYPAQSIRANGMRCWNWFDASHQTREKGEPSLIAGITREVAAEFGIDTTGIFVAGLSAGAAMAVIMGATYPDLFSAVGVHSGVPYRAASKLQMAFATLSGFGSPTAVLATEPPLKQFVPTIVFHCDRDNTVRIENGLRIVEQAVALYAASHAPLSKAVAERAFANGLEYTVTRYSDSAKRSVVEYWVVHGAGHTWSGGSATGSYADEHGPNASEEMVRFFMEQEVARTKSHTPCEVRGYELQ